MSQRAAVLCPVDEGTNEYAIELTQRGYFVDLYSDIEALTGGLNRDREPVSILVLDALAPEQREALVRDLVRSTRVSSPKCFWIANSKPAGTDVDFVDELRGEGESARLIVRGNLDIFRVRLDWLGLWLTPMQLRPTLTVQHIRPAATFDERGPMDYKRWLFKHGCHHRETISDILKDGTSLMRRGKELPDPLRRRDLYYIDRILRASVALTLERWTCSMTDYSYVLGSQIFDPEKDGPSYASTKNAKKRFCGALTLEGLDAHQIIKFRDGSYLVDRSLVNIEVEHLRE